MGGREEAACYARNTNGGLILNLWCRPPVVHRSARMRERKFLGDCFGAGTIQITRPHRSLACLFAPNGFHKSVLSLSGLTFMCSLKEAKKVQGLISGKKRDIKLLIIGDAI